MLKLELIDHIVHVTNFEDHIILRSFGLISMFRFVSFNYDSVFGCVFIVWTEFLPVLVLDFFLRSMNKIRFEC